MLIPTGSLDGDLRYRDNPILHDKPRITQSGNTPHSPFRSDKDPPARFKIVKTVKKIIRRDAAPNPDLDVTYAASNSCAVLPPTDR